MNWVEHTGWLDAAWWGSGETISPIPLATGHLEGFRCRSCRVITLRYKGDEPAEAPLPHSTPSGEGRVGRPTE